VAWQGAAQWVMESVVQPVKRLTYRERMKQTLGRDPQKCPRCGAEMWLWKVWHPKYKVINALGEQLRREAKVEYERTLPSGQGRTSDAGIGGGSHLPLYYFFASRASADLRIASIFPDAPAGSGNGL
jgi:hypothetical protein